MTVTIGAEIQKVFLSDYNIFHNIGEFASAEQGNIFEIAAAVGDIVGDPSITDAFGFAGGALILPGAIADIGNIINKVSACAEIFADANTSFAEREQAVRDSVVSFMNCTFTMLSGAKFADELEIIDLANLVGRISIAADVLNTVASVSECASAITALVEIGARAESARDAYAIEMDNLSLQNHVWELIRYSSSGIGSVLGLAAAIGGFLISPWITLAIAVVVFVGSVGIFWTDAEIDRYEDVHTIDKIITQLNRGSA
jgi:hypothetical protein